MCALTSPHEGNTEERERVVSMPHAQRGGRHGARSHNHEPQPKSRAGHSTD